MAHFVEIEGGVVKRGIVVREEDCADGTGPEYCSNLLGGEWVQTSKKREFRYNYAGKGFSYDADAPPQGGDGLSGAFTSPRPYPSWELDDEYKWQPPVPMPDDAGPDKLYDWNEEAGEWVEIDMIG